MIPVAPRTKVKLNIKGEVVETDSDLTIFSEQTLNVYMERIAAWRAYYGAKLAEAEQVSLDAEADYERLYDERFHENKDMGGSDKYAEAKTGSDPDVAAARSRLNQAKRDVKQLVLFLKSLEVAQENATSRGHTLRKEMSGDATIMGNSFAQRAREAAYDASLEEQVDDIVGKVNE